MTVKKFPRLAQKSAQGDGLVEMVLTLARAQSGVDIIPQGASPGVLKVTDGEVPGCILAFRAGGDEVLFAAADGRPLMWVEVDAFAIDPRAFRFRGPLDASAPIR